MAKINWKPKSPIKSDYECLSYGDCFKIDTLRSSGAIYMKTTYDNVDCMLELATGKVFSRTYSVIKPVDVEINIDTSKPSIY